MITTEMKSAYAAMYVLKMLDLEEEDGGVQIGPVLPHDWVPLEDVIESLLVDGKLEVKRRKSLYELTDKGVDYLGTLIDEAETYVEEFDDKEMEDVVAELKQRKLDQMRVRFLWGWYQGEFDDMVVFQQRRGISPVENDWATFLLSDAFYEDLALDLDLG
ncbi:MAG: hypothetical protein V3V08_01625 [Nannocystaceae bacterium]